MLYDVEHMMQEANSGVSFEQYFRWAAVEELRRIEGHLSDLELVKVLELLRQAMKVAFPRGLPSTEEEKDEATSWQADQAERLAALFDALEDENGRVMNVLGEYARRVGL